MQNTPVYIRALTLDDTNSLCHYRQQNRDFLALFEPIRPDSYFTYEGQQKVIEDEIMNWKKDISYGFGIFLTNNDELIGRVNLSNITRRSWQNCTIGYSIAENMQGNGYMTKAVKLAVQFAFEEASLHRVQAGVMPGNKGSIRVLEKVGFLYEGLSKYHLKIHGIWEDHEIFAITKETWDSFS
ncbi:GNAT family N-acetyltransferase [Shimazuella alba]|uniref:GNAT family N-acetyltransferase n=1 Tax=Shimazuella alba TaxID=2690964 RepID=A0A6I4VXE7_9BACL|nr:GNAT family protein [Shimazuella alba]MXQ53134.1 GNAT family N-acetyltransferase [Shimazuella alba]